MVNIKTDRALPCRFCKSISILVQVFQILIRVYERAVDYDREMEMRTGSNTAVANFCNGLALCYLLTYIYKSFGTVEVFGLNAVAMVNGYIMTGRVVVGYGFNCTGKCCYDTQSVSTTDIQSLVIGTGACGRSFSITKVGVNRVVTGKRPDDVCQLVRILVFKVLCFFLTRKKRKAL